MFLRGSVLWELWYFGVFCRFWGESRLPSKKRIKFKKRGLTKGKKSGSIHGRLEEGREREAVEKEGEKDPKKVLDKADRMW